MYAVHVTICDFIAFLLLCIIIGAYMTQSFHKCHTSQPAYVINCEISWTISINDLLLTSEIFSIPLRSNKIHIIYVFVNQQCSCWWHCTNNTNVTADTVMSKFGNGTNPDSKVHGANMGPTWVLSAPDGSHCGPKNLAIREHLRGCQIVTPGLW